MKSRARLGHPLIAGTILALISLTAGAGAALAADFGKPAWLIIPLLALLVTAGLPTLAAVLLLASAWGKVRPFYGLEPFLVVAMLLAVLAQSAAIYMLKAFGRVQP